MDNNKLIQLLQTFTKKEWRDFSKFIKSPYFNTDRQCGQLLDILKKELSRDSNYMLSRERLEGQFQKIVEKGNAQLNAKLSNLTRLAEQFLTIEKLEAKPLCSKHLLLNSLFERGLNNHFERVYKKDISRHKSPEKVSKEYYLYKFLVEQENQDYIVASSKKIFITRENLQKVNEILDTFYVLNKIDFFNIMTLGKLSYQKNYDWTSFAPLESILQLPCFTNHPVVQLHYAGYKLMQDAANTAYYKHLVELLFKHGNMLAPLDLQKFYVMAANYCVREIRKGCLHYHPEIHYLYKEMEEKGLLLVREWADVRTLQNVIFSGLKNDKLEWANYIIEKYKNKIEPNIRKDTYNYFRAIYSFHTKDFEATIKYLSFVHSVDNEFNMNIKLLTLKSYYEQDTEYSYHTEQVIRSYKVFFRQSKTFSKPIRDSYINFGKVIGSLYRVKHNEGRGTIENIVQQIEQYEQLIDKKWLKEKIGMLKNTSVNRFR